MPDRRRRRPRSHDTRPDAATDRASAGVAHRHPAIGNDTISMLKFTSLVSVLALPDCSIGADGLCADLPDVPLLLVATIWYLVLTTILTLLEHLVENG